MSGPNSTVSEVATVPQPLAEVPAQSDEPEFPPSSVVEALLALDASEAQQKQHRIHAKTGEVFLPSGWKLSMYDSDLQFHYNVPSEQVTATVGALKYCKYHETYGYATRFRSQLCRSFSADRRCSNAKNCHFIHAIIDSDAGPAQNVHVNENLSDCATATDVVNSQRRPLQNTYQYPVLPGNALLPVFAPNSTEEEPQMVYASNILVTKGSLAAVRALSIRDKPNKHVPASQPRHCAHFQFRKLCNLGADCNYIHSLAPYLQPKYRGANPQPVPPHATSTLPRKTVSTVQAQPQQMVGMLPTKPQPAFPWLPAQPFTTSSFPEGSSVTFQNMSGNMVLPQTINMPFQGTGSNKVSMMPNAGFPQQVMFVNQPPPTTQGQFVIVPGPGGNLMLVPQSNFSGARPNVLQFVPMPNVPNVGVPGVQGVPTQFSSQQGPPSGSVSQSQSNNIAMTAPTLSQYLPSNVLEAVR